MEPGNDSDERQVFEGIQSEVVMDLRAWVGKMVACPRTTDLDKALDTWSHAELSGSENMGSSDRF